MNIPYGIASGFNGLADTLEMDIYLPQCDDSLHISKRPLMIWIHGGAFVSGDKSDVTGLCQQFARKGYVTASVNYRLGFVSDNAFWNCNFPNYNCIFAADTAEWYRANYRAIQDVKGAIRFFVNRKDSFRIDVDNIFVSGVSAGAITAMGVALMDTASERWMQTFALDKLPKPNSSTLNCQHNQGESFPLDSVLRPDLGGINGTIEPTNIDYTIKGVANIFGGIFTDLLAQSRSGKTKPAIFTFHQPCDLLVSIDRKKIFWGLSWCFTNGYNGYSIANTPLLYGSRAISVLNNSNSYGYLFENKFTNTEFPYSFLLGQASCTDQFTNSSCHDIDNINNRILQLSQFFAPLVSTSPICDTGYFPVPPVGGFQTGFEKLTFRVFPNPSLQKIFFIETSSIEPFEWAVYNSMGLEIFNGTGNKVSLEDYSKGIYLLKVKTLKNVFVEKLVIP
ncbi:MAG TPA: carboxylesterase family protein [Edaphocola sp.]|nr:carboxylesterase family protein [Edaphocola sp.]